MILGQQENTVYFEGLENETINFTGELISVTDGKQSNRLWFQPRYNWPRNRSHVSLRYCKNVTLNALKVTGPHKNGGTSAGAYVESKEAQHALEIQDSENITVNGFSASYIYGDGAYVRRCKNVVFNEYEIHHNGRQGIAIVDSSNIRLANGHQYDIRRSHVDLENNWFDEIHNNIQVINNKYGISRLGWISNKGRGITKNVVIYGNDLYGENFDVTVDGAENYFVLNNESRVKRGNPQGMIMKMLNVDSLVIEGNKMVAAPGRNMHIAGCHNCQNVFLGENEVINGKNEIIYH